MGDIVLLNLIGVKVVLVHGGGPHIKSALDQLGIESKFINGLRVTDEATMKVVQMVLAGQVNKDLVNLIGSIGGKAIGLCGIDDQMIKVRKQSDELGYVGRITDVDVSIIQDNLDKGYIPVISTIGTDTDGRGLQHQCRRCSLCHCKGHACGKTGISDGYRRGLQRPEDPESLISKLFVKEAKELIFNGNVGGGMIPKLQNCMDAIEEGVSRVHILDGRIKTLSASGNLYG